ncbi:UNVERIFIED_CONTAM: Asparagine--tRNA ligase, cytoplasmic 1, partial [Sesamum angustifolium]
MFGSGIAKKDGKIDYALDSFASQGKHVLLYQDNCTTAQLQVETYACALSPVYTFRPTLRAEHLHTSRHLVEFWMVEPEIAFTDIQDDMNCAEPYV